MNQDAIVTIALAVGSWVVSGLITYGFMKRALMDLEAQLDRLTQKHDKLNDDFIKYQIDTLRTLLDRQNQSGV